MSQELMNKEPVLTSRPTHATKATQPTRPSHGKVFIALLITVFIMPWPHGGEIVWQYLLFCISIFTLGAIYFFTSNTNNANHTSNTKHQHQTLTSLKAPLFLLGAWLLFQIIQIIPLPISITSNINSQVHKTKSKKSRHISR